MNMLWTPIFDFYLVERRGVNWTVTMSTYVFIAVSLVFFVAALRFLKSSNEKTFLKYTALFFLYAFLFTIYIAGDSFYSYFGLLSILLSALVGILFYVSVRDNYITIQAVTIFWTISTVFVIVPVLLVQIDTEQFAKLSEEYSAIRILYGYENPRALGWVSTVFLSFLAAYLSTQAHDKRTWLIFLVLITISSTTLFWSGSRGGLVAFVASYAIIVLFSQAKNLKGILSVTFCVILGGILSDLLFLPSGSFGIFPRINTTLEQESVNAASSGRFELWKTTISYIYERPLTGYGFLPHKNLDGFTHGSAHNIILDLWLSFGLIVGTIVMVASALFWITVVKFFRKANDPIVAAFVCVIITLLVYSMGSGPYARTFPLLLFAIPTGVVLGLRAAKTK
jgi:O-antigen ligase